MGKRITSLTEITTVTENDYIPVDNAATGARKLSADFINDLEDEIDGKQDALTAGANISITQDGTISATDTTYTAGTNVDITNGVISATDTDTLSGLTDTTISSPSDGDALVYDSTSGKWVNGGVASDINDLNDVDITTPTDGQVLSYDATNQEWVNADAGSDVSVTQIQSSGTKIATVTVDNVDTDLYAPTGGSANSYGYTTPSSSSGSDGDIYNKIEDITGTDETVTTPVSVTTNTTFQFPKSISEYSTITVTGSNGGTDFEPQTVAVENIGTDMSHQTYIGTSGIMWYKTTDSVVMWATNAEITSCYGTYTNSHKIVDIYQKTSDSWSKYEDKGSIVEANPSSTGSTDLTKIGIDGTVYNIPTGGSGSSTLAGLTDVDITSPTNGQALVYDATNQEWINADVGGSGSNYEETVLWDDILTPDTSGSNITLFDAITNYDQLLFVLKPANSTEITYAYFPVSELEVSGTYSVIAIGGYSTYAYFTYNSATSLNIISWASADRTQYQKIIGIKFGGGSGGGGSSYSENELWADINGLSFNLSSPQQITLADNISNYDMIGLVFTDTVYTTQRGFAIFPVSQIDKTGTLGFWTSFLIPENTLNSPIAYYIDDTHIRIVSPTGRVTLVAYAVIGFKFGGSSGGGGNLYGTTDPTSDLGNNGDIYMKYTGGSEPVEGDWETICSTETRTSSGAVVMSNFDPTAYKKIKFYGYYVTYASASSANKSFTSSEIDVEDIPAYGETGLVIGSDYVCVTLGQDGNSLYVYPSNGWKWAVSEIDATPLTLYPPKINKVFGKIEDEWLDFPEEGYEETTLWEGSQSITQYSVPFTIPDIGMAELNKYDAFAFDFYSTYSIPRIGIMLTSYIKNHKDADITLAPDPADGAHPLFMHYESANDILKAVATTNYGYTLTKVIGIKYGTGGSSSSQHIYSTTEQVVGKWIDGSDIYEVTIPTSVTFTGSNVWKSLGVALSDYNIAAILDVTIIGTENTGNVPALKHAEYVEVVDGYISAYQNFNWNMTSSHITFRYTKSTT